MVGDRRSGWGRGGSRRCWRDECRVSSAWLRRGLRSVWSWVGPRGVVEGCCRGSGRWGGSGCHRSSGSGSSSSRRALCVEIQYFTSTSPVDYADSKEGSIRSTAPIYPLQQPSSRATSHGSETGTLTRRQAESLTFKQLTDSSRRRTIRAKRLSGKSQGWLEVSRVSLHPSKTRTYLPARILVSSLRIAKDLRMRLTGTWTQACFDTIVLFIACMATVIFCRGGARVECRSCDPFCTPIGGIT
jgi:hypothetical protein